MKKSFLLSIFFYMSLCAVASPNADLMAAIDRVTEMYTNFQHISNASREASTARLNLLDDSNDRLFCSLSMRAPGDLIAIGVCSPDKYDINVENYVNRYYDFSRTNKIKFGFSVIGEKSRMREDAVGPQFRKLESESHYAEVVVEKFYDGIAKPLKVTDTILIDTETKLIINWTNRTSLRQENIIQPGESIENLKFLAAHAYSLGNYSKAYQLYEKILTMQPNEQEASYKLAIMLYKKNGTPMMSDDKKQDKRMRDKRILELLDTAIKGRRYQISECATNMKYWITC